MLKFYIAVAQHREEKDYFGFSRFKGSCCTASCITRLTRQLSHVIKGDEIGCFRVEWKALQVETIPSNWYETGKFSFMVLCFLFF